MLSVVVWKTQNGWDKELSIFLAALLIRISADMIKYLIWSNSYKNIDNFLFYAHEEIVRFINRFVIRSEHENNTIQSFFTEKKINKLFRNFFSIIEIVVIDHKNLITDSVDSRYHLILKRV